MLYFQENNKFSRYESFRFSFDLYHNNASLQTSPLPVATATTEWMTCDVMPLCYATIFILTAKFL
jgi:hypothetical protein